MALAAAQLLRFELNYERIKVGGGSKGLAIVAYGREKARIDAEVELNYMKSGKRYQVPVSSRKMVLALCLSCSATSGMLSGRWPKVVATPESMWGALAANGGR